MRGKRERGEGRWCEEERRGKGARIIREGGGGGRGSGAIGEWAVQLGEEEVKG